MPASKSLEETVLETANPEPGMRALSLELAQVAQKRQQKMQAVTTAVNELL